MDVKVYSTPTCPYCRLAKEYLSSRRVSFESFDVAADQERAREMINLTGQLSVPVIVIDGRIIIGFDKARIDELINSPSH